MRSWRAFSSGDSRVHILVSSSARDVGLPYTGREAGEWFTKQVHAGIGLSQPGCRQAGTMGSITFFLLLLDCLHIDSTEMFLLW
jgi:hypothetical protein